MMRVAILGAGGLGKAAAQIIECKQTMTLVGVADASGFIYDAGGVSAAEIVKVKAGGSVAELPAGCDSDDSIGEIVKLGDRIDGVFLALPNLPNEFIPGVVRRFLEGGFRGSFVDALKRTRAMEMVFDLDTPVREAQCTYLTGCGATPGLLTAAAALAAQSYVQVEDVNIWWGVGIERWDDYKATIREDIAHLPGYDVERAKAMSEQEVEDLLNATEGKLTLHEMEHADDVMLERAGVIDGRCARFDRHDGKQWRHEQHESDDCENHERVTHGRVQFSIGNCNALSESTGEILTTRSSSCQSSANSQ
jgi:hypothetical protein